MKRADREQGLVERAGFVLGLEIFVHSVKMVLRNLTQALQISVVPAFIGGALVVGLFFLFGIPLEEFNSETTGFPEGVTAGSFTGFLLSIVVVVFGVMLWIVVSWHRFVLLEEYPTGLVPPFRFDRVLAYFGRLLMLFLLAFVIMIPAALIMSMLAQSSAVLGSIFWVGLVIVLTLAFYRASPILPGAAIGKSVKLSEAWQATSGASGAIALLVVLSVMFQILLQLLASILLFIPIIGVLIVLFASMVIVPLINVSILTTIYGVFIEKRELS